MGSSGPNAEYVETVRQLGGLSRSNPTVPQQQGQDIDLVRRDELARGIAAAFRSDTTPPFPKMVATLFNSSNPQQRAGVVNELLQSVSAGAVRRIAGGVLGRMLGPDIPGSISAEQACRLSPSDVSAIAAHAAQNDPSTIDRLGSFYSQHPALVKTLGSVALGVLSRHQQSQQ